MYVHCIQGVRSPGPEVMNGFGSNLNLLEEQQVLLITGPKRKYCNSYILNETTGNLCVYLSSLEYSFEAFVA